MLPENPRVVVSIPPLAGLIQPLLPEGTEVITLLESGRSVHGWDPAPSTLAMVRTADVIVMIGMGLEPRLEQVVDGLSGDPLVLVMADIVGASSEHHDHAHHHSHDGHVCGVGGDPHLWLDPALAAQFVRQVGPILAAGERTEAWVSRIEALDRELAGMLEPWQGRAIVSHHAAFGRFAEHYGLTVAEVLQPLEVAEPTPAELARAIQAVRDHSVEVIFIEPQFSPAAAEFVANATGARLSMLDPLGRGDWEATVRQIGETIAREFAQQPSQARADSGR